MFNFFIPFYKILAKLVRIETHLIHTKFTERHIMLTITDIQTAIADLTKVTAAEAAQAAALATANAAAAVAVAKDLGDQIAALKEQLARTGQQVTEEQFQAVLDSIKPLTVAINAIIPDPVVVPPVAPV